jgi:hypothetical protein
MDKYFIDVAREIRLSSTSNPQKRSQRCVQRRAFGYEIITLEQSLLSYQGGFYTYFYATFHCGSKQSQSCKDVIILPILIIFVVLTVYNYNHFGFITNHKCLHFGNYHMSTTETEVYQFGKSNKSNVSSN